MMKKWIPILLCGSLLAGSMMAIAASDEVPPSLSTVYNLAVQNKLSPEEVALAYVHVLVAQRKMELTQAHISFVKKEAKEANGVFVHPNQDIQESVEGSVDLTQADSFAAQAEYQANLSYLNQLVGKAYSQVKPFSNDAIAANLDPKLKARYTQMMTQLQQLQYAQASGQAKSEVLIQKEQDLYTAQQNYWDDVQIYLTSHIKAEGTPAVIADLQENPINTEKNHWAVADPRLVTADNEDKVAELASDSSRPGAATMLKAIKKPVPVKVSRVQVKQIELAASKPVPPVTQAPPQPVIPQPEPSVNSAELISPVAKPLAVENKPVAELQNEISKPIKKSVTRTKVAHQKTKVLAVHNTALPAKKVVLTRNTTLKKVATNKIKVPVVKAVAQKTARAPQVASLETFHDYILPEPSTTAVQLSQIDLPAPQSTKFDYV